ncbi:MAG: efflux RND transporter permease subunit [Myxococcales bacterium]|nr:efflux RND transporter permease subunit [Myxococcales bacterium]
MFDAIIRFSLKHAWFVVAAALVLLGYGAYAARTLPVDVLPEIAAPSVTIVTEANSMAPEEVERLVTLPIEQSLQGSPGLRRLRSSSAVGISLVWAEFDWDVSTAQARQAVTEKLATARASLPPGVDPVLAPASSVMGEIMFVGVESDGSVDEGELREIAEWAVRRRLLAVEGIAQVVPIGGAVRRVEIVIDPAALVEHRLALDDVLEVLRGAMSSSPGGFVSAGAQEYLVRGIGQPRSLEEVRSMRVAERAGVVITVGDIAAVSLAVGPRRGDAAVGGNPAVVLKVAKQAHVNTLEVTARVDEAMDDLASTLPAGVSLYRKGFRQADFIRVAVNNVGTVLRDGAILVTVVLAMFLLSWRTTLISLLALPLSLAAGLAVLHLYGASINTMTLGGFAIAIGELVDDAIVDVENVHRRLRENALLRETDRRPILDVVFAASKEIRSSVVFATVIIVLVFAPLFFLSGIEGKLLRPLGVAYVTSIAASLLVALTITPVLCLLLLGRGSVAHHASKESPLVRLLKRGYRPLVAVMLRAPVLVALVSLLGAGGAVAALSRFGRSFLPEFNEGSLNIAAATAPGTSLDTSNKIVRRLESYLVEHPAVTSVIRSTGRAERDEHALDVNFSELEVGLDLKGRDREALLEEIREQSATIPGLAVTVGQPISHRIEHLVSGVRASLALKIYGDDLDQLRILARQAEAAMKGVPGLVDITVEQQTEIPEIVILPMGLETASFGMTPGELAGFVETALTGSKVGTYYERGRVYDVISRLPRDYAAAPDKIALVPVDFSGERFAELGSIARITRTLGPNLINHENGQRRILVTANVAGRDIRGAAEEVIRVTGDVAKPKGYRMELGGQFESEASASRTIFILSGVAIFGIVALLYMAFRSFRDAFIVLFNLPLALVGGAVAVELGGGVLSIASLVGFITLFGIATRNGIMMVTHYRQLIAEGESIRDAVLRGSLDRLVPILMTALTAAIALIPIVRAAGEPGNEIQAPMAAVILGGLLSSTVLNLLVIPPLFARFGSGRSAQLSSAAPSTSQS